MSQEYISTEINIILLHMMFENEIENKGTGYEPKDKSPVTKTHQLIYYLNKEVKTILVFLSV